MSELTPIVPLDGRNFWVSIDPPVDEDRSTATLWRAFIYLRADSGGMLLEKVDVDTDRQGWAALAEVDDVLASCGYTRTHPWEIGSGAGFVAWIEPDVEHLLLDAAEQKGEAR